MTFVGEGAVDTGGPRREFLRLLAMNLSNGPYLQSGEDGSFFACNTTGYQVCVCYWCKSYNNVHSLLRILFEYVIAVVLFSLFIGQPLQDNGPVCSDLGSAGWLWISFLSSKGVYVYVHWHMVTSGNSKFKYPRL